MDIPENLDGLVWLELALRNLYYYITNNARKNDLIGISIRSNNFPRGSAELLFRPVTDFSSESLWNLISSIAQSNKSFELEESFTVNVTTINVPRGKGRKKSESIDSVKKLSIVSINNEDDFCLLRAIVLRQVYLGKHKLDSRGEADDVHRSSFTRRIMLRATTD